MKKTISVLVVSLLAVVAAIIRFDFSFKWFSDNYLFGTLCIIFSIVIVVLVSVWSKALIKTPDSFYNFYATVILGLILTLMLLSYTTLFGLVGRYLKKVIIPISITGISVVHIIFLIKILLHRNDENE